MVTTAPEDKPLVKDRAGAGGRNPTTLAEKNVSAEASSARRGKRRRITRSSESPSPVQRFFLTKNGSNGSPELEQEVEDENAAMVEALKTGRTFIILSEWRPTVDNTTKGRPIITKEAVSKAG